MIELSINLLRTVVAEARLAPSVHNVQPSRWRLVGNRLLLLGDPSRAIPVADPAGRDWRLSHGAHLEGLALALAARGARLAEIQKLPAAPATGGSEAGGVFSGGGAGGAPDCRQRRQRDSG